MTTNHYRAALSLRPVILAASGERRGHVLAPGRATDTGKVDPKDLPDRVPPMLMPGDHELSYKWASDEGFRKRMAAKLSAKALRRSK
jgi:hypothetical protein